MTTLYAALQRAEEDMEKLKKEYADKLKNTNHKWCPDMERQLEAQSMRIAHLKGNQQGEKGFMLFGRFVKYTDLTDEQLESLSELIK